MSDLIRGQYPVTHGLKKATGGFQNATQANVMARSNAEFLGLANLADTATIVAATGVAVGVAVPVEYGDIISKVTVLVGATAAGTPTNQWGALYSGVASPALLSQSVDGTTGAIAASGAFTFTLAAPQVVTSAIAPNGYLYAAFMVKATTIPSVATVSVATAVGYKWFTNSPLFMAASFGAALAGTAPANITSPAAIATVPAVFCT